MREAGEKQAEEEAKAARALQAEASVRAELSASVGICWYPGLFEVLSAIDIRIVARWIFHGIQMKSEYSVQRFHLAFG